MPDQRAKHQAQADRRAGKAPYTQAGHFVRAEIKAEKAHSKGSAKSKKQTIAIGLSKARKAGVKIPAPPYKKG